MVLGKRKKEIAGLKEKIANLESEKNRLQKSVRDAGIADNPLFNLSVLSRILEVNGIGIFISSSSKEFLWLSSSASDILGYKTDANITQEQFKISILPEDRPIFEKAVADIRQGFKIAEFELKIARNEGEGREFRLVAVHLIRISNDDTHEELIFAGSIKDITRQDKIRRDLIKARDKAEESEKLKNSLLTNISHDIRTPMNSIIGFSELLHIGNLAYDKRLEYVKTIKNQSLLLLKMIDDLVELTRIETGKITIRKSPCNIDLLLNELLTVFNQVKLSHSKEHIDIKINFPENRGMVIYTDPGRLQQVISSLVTNFYKIHGKRLD